MQIFGFKLRDYITILIFWSVGELYVQWDLVGYVPTVCIGGLGQKVFDNKMLSLFRNWQQKTTNKTLEKCNTKIFPPSLSLACSLNCPPLLSVAEIWANLVNLVKYLVLSAGQPVTRSDKGERGDAGDAGRTSRQLHRSSGQSTCCQIITD